MGGLMEPAAKEAAKKAKAESIAEIKINHA